MVGNFTEIWVILSSKTLRRGAGLRRGNFGRPHRVLRTSMAMGIWIYMSAPLMRLTDFT